MEITAAGLTQKAECSPKSGNKMSESNQTFFIVHTVLFNPSPYI